MIPFLNKIKKLYRYFYPEKVYTVRNELTIYLKEGNYVVRVIEEWCGENLLTPWADLYKWFHTDTSPTFLLRGDFNSTSLVRDQILKIEVNLYSYYRKHKQ